MSSGVSVIVPTYQEAGNIPLLIARLEAVRQARGLELELILSDDDSQDGTAQVVAQAGRPWVRLLVRTTNRGLGPAVLDGLRLARHDRLMVMDADLSHPPERVPDLIAALDEGADFVIGSRYIEGGTTDAEWGFFRWLNSKVATLLARPFTSAKDPMAGFFALRREKFEAGRDLNPIGYKIGLELIVKCRCHKIVEVPIHFADRKVGESKLSVREQLRYLQHLRRLFIYRYPNWSYLFQFAVVGASGTLVNLAVLTLLVQARLPETIAIAGGILVSFLSNFALNRRFTFSYARHRSLLRHFVGFAGASALGMLTNYTATLLFRYRFPSLPIQLAAIVGILCGMVLNFLICRYVVFRKPQPAVGQPPAKDLAASEG
jgi:dolichol-phosphate mannosyltransferase